MLEVFSIFLTLILIAKAIEGRMNIPFILTVILLSYIVTYFFDLSLLKNNFHEIMYLMLPIILIPDVLGLSTDELKENSFSIFFLAVVAVIISIIMALFFTASLGYFHNISIYYLLLLFTPLMATDVVSVGAIFGNFNIPHRLKLYAEGESLFNDITAMVIFFFIAIPLSNGNNIEITDLIYITLKTILLSTFIGIFFGFLGYISFKHSLENFSEIISVYLMASLSFLIADKLELSGILSVVIAVIYFKYLFNKEGDYKKKNIVAILLKLNSPKNNSDLGIRAYKKESQYVGFFANAVIFVSIATVINIDLLWKYRMEIFYVFILTTVIRYIVMVSFIKYKKYPIRWSNILTLAGMKGGLAVIMIVSLNDNFIYKEMFLTITLGVVILSIFLYTLFLIIYLYTQKDNLRLDEAGEHNIKDIKDIKDLLKKEINTEAYNEIIFEELVEKEITRAQRYKKVFSIISFKLDGVDIKPFTDKMRESDYLGKITSEYYAILFPRTSLDDLMGYIDNLKKVLGEDQHISVVQYSIGDSLDMLYEKLLTGLKNKNNISIEV